MTMKPTKNLLRQLGFYYLIRLSISKLVVTSLYLIHAFANDRDPKWDLIICLWEGTCYQCAATYHIHILNDIDID